MVPGSAPVTPGSATPVAGCAMVFSGCRIGDAAQAVVASVSSAIMSLAPRHLMGVLVSERGGAFAWHPILIAGLAGLALARRRLDRRFRVAALTGIALQVYLIACWSMWWGGASFGSSACRRPWTRSPKP